MKFTLLLIPMLLLSACGTTTDPLSPAKISQPKIIINQIKPLKDGEFASWKLDKGKYKLEMTASGDGAAVEWLGASCQSVKESPIFKTDCTFTQTGQLIVKNPTRFGLGDDISVTVRLVRLPD